MNTIKCAIIDDEPFAIELLEDYIQRIPHLELIASFDHPILGLQHLQTHPIDLLFLDIEMPELTGMELITALTSKQTQVVFTTAYSEYAVQSYDKDALDYLLKPITFERFLLAINKFQTQKQQLQFVEKEDSIYIKTNGGFKKLSYSEIGFIKAIKDYVMIYTKDHHFIVYHSLKKLEQALPKCFQRVHHSYTINLTNLSEIKYHHCHIWGEKIPISKKYRAEVYEVVGKRLL